jgi:hypothetical protein
MSEEREAFEAWYDNPARNVYIHDKASAYKGWQSARQSAEPVYDKSVVARIATQMGWTPPDATTLRVLSSHAIRKHEGVTIFGDPAQVLKVIAAIEGAGSDCPHGVDDGACKQCYAEKTGREPICATCNGYGMIGGPSYYAPDEGGEPCPDCAAPIGDNGTRQLADHRIRHIPGESAIVGKPAESKRVELTEHERSLIELVITWLEKDGMQESADAFANLLARAQAKGE